ncbi:MAG: thermonuclease family protein [Planctomycetes bacterium]|nr:thermonuclease family protein [Planctomycetota bacterium]
MIRNSDPSMRRWLCSLVLAGAGFLIQGGMVFGQTAGDSSNQAGANKSQKESEKEEEITAKVIKVIDGDSIKVRTAEGKEYEIQIEGTDAPELKQEYGKESSEALKKMVFDSDVRVSWKKKDNFDRPLAQVYRGDRHINAEMISSGNAWHFKRYNQSQALADLEIQAKKEKKGLWKLENPIAPWDYRKENRAPDKPDR